MDYRQIAELEEARQAVGTAEVALHSEQVAGGIMSFAGIGSWANQACGLGLDGPVSDADLDRFVDFYVERGVEPKLEVCPFADETLIKGLAARGFELREFENVLFRDLSIEHDLRGLLEQGWPHDLDLVHVEPGNKPQVRTFVEVSTSGFRPPDQPIDDVFFDVTSRVVQHPRCDHYLAMVEGKPVGGGGMESSGEIACLFGTSVLPEFRRRGIQAALIVRRLERARELSCRWGVIHTLPGIATERNSRRLGFELAYTKVIMAKPGNGLSVSP